MWLAIGIVMYTVKYVDGIITSMEYFDIQFAEQT